jgi:hypothetical protein
MWQVSYGYQDHKPVVPYSPSGSKQGLNWQLRNDMTGIAYTLPRYGTFRMKGTAKYSTTGSFLRKSSEI